MKRYNWTVYDIENRIDKLQNLMKNTNNSDEIDTIIDDIMGLKEWIANYFDYNTYDQKSLIENYNEIKDEYIEIPYLWYYFKEFADGTKLIHNNNLNLKRCNLSKDDLFTLTHDFYKSLNSFFYGNFMKNFYRRRDHVKFDTCQDTREVFGETIVIQALNELFISINRNYSIKDLFVMIHEYSHATSFQINNKHLCSQKSLYAEIDAIFMELIAGDYFHDKLGNDVNLLKIDSYNRYAYTSKNLKHFLNLARLEFDNSTNIIFSNNKQLKSCASNHGLNPLAIEEFIETGNLFSRYLTSFMFALELYYKYLEDPERALDTLKKIINLNCQVEEDYYHNIKKLGLIPNQSLYIYQSELNDKNKTLIHH